MSILLCNTCSKLLNTSIKLKSIPKHYPAFFKTYCRRLQTNVLGRNWRAIDYTNVLTSSRATFSTLPEIKDTSYLRNVGPKEKKLKKANVEKKSVSLPAREDVYISLSAKDQEFDHPDQLVLPQIFEFPWQNEGHPLFQEGLEADESENHNPGSISKPSEINSLKNKKKKLDLTLQEEQTALIEAIAKANHHKKLCAYLDVCLRTNQHKKAYQTLVYFLTVGKKRKFLDVDNIKIFNIVFQTWATMGELTYFKNMTKMIEKDGVALNYQSFAFWLECVSRQNNLSETELKEEVELILNRIKSQGFILEEIFIKTILCKEQQQLVLDVLNKCVCNFKPIPVTHLEGYTCSLLDDLNKSSKTFRPAMVENIVNEEELKLWSYIQLSQELQSEVNVKSVYTKEKESAKTLIAMGKIEQCENFWRQGLLLSFQRNLKLLQHKVKKDKAINLYPFLMVLPPEAFVDLIIKEIRILLDATESFGCSINYLHKNLGVKVMKKYFSKIKQTDGYIEQMSDLHQQYLVYCLDSELSTQYLPREYWNHLVSKMDATLYNYKFFTWPYSILINIGDYLYNFILNDVKIDLRMLDSKKSIGVQIPAFYKVLNQKVQCTKGEIKPHPQLLKLYRESSKKTISFDVSVLPMLCPPVPWNKVNSGGFLVSPVTFIRLPDSVRITEDLTESASAQQLYPVFDSLNTLGQCPWVINKPILDYIIEIFNNGGSEELGIPSEVSSLDQPPDFTNEQSYEEREQVKRQRSIYQRKKSEAYGLWCDSLYKLSIANHFRDRIFWFPHNLDFRGRVYPTPPHFNHLGSDLVRGILLFAIGNPLGKNGLNWLKIHAINLTGSKKRNSMSERLQYANEIMPEILDSADQPFSGNGWWKTSEEPWQTLACCKEIAKAIRSENPEEFICQFPVHQDGSCNGLQHYAALGRDLKGAQQVNLTPSERPNDVYSAVATRVEKTRQEDAARGLEIAQVLEGHVSRKVIKQTVMTMVYGVTKFGARRQIIRRLDDIESFPDEQLWKASGYLVTKTFESIGELFTKTRIIQDWFTASARQISKMRLKPVEWITPLGLPVIQPYFRTTKDNRIFLIPNKRLPNLMKQKNAFPPNYIHSLDSTHMMLTSLFCHREGIVFVSVHDCYWTHPNTVDIMSKVCRDQFVALHSEPLLENLSNFFVDKFSFPESELLTDDTFKSSAKIEFNKLLKQIPEKGSLQLEDILQSVYFFS